MIAKKVVKGLIVFLSSILVIYFCFLLTIILFTTAAVAHGATIVYKNYYYPFPYVRRVHWAEYRNATLLPVTDIIGTNFENGNTGLEDIDKLNIALLLESQERIRKLWRENKIQMKIKILPSNLDTYGNQIEIGWHSNDVVIVGSKGLDTTWDVDNELVLHLASESNDYIVKYKDDLLVKFVLE